MFISLKGIYYFFSSLIFQNCFPEIMALLWPHLTNEDGEFELGSEAQRAYLFLTNIIGRVSYLLIPFNIGIKMYNCCLFDGKIER